MVPREFLGAFKAGHHPSAKQFIDEELSYELLKRVVYDSDEQAREALEYLTKFNNEFHKGTTKKGDKNALHNTDELRRDCYARVNAKNRDVFSKCAVFLVGTYEDQLIKKK